MGLRVTIYCLTARPAKRALPDLHGAEVRWLRARQPIARALAIVRAVAPVQPRVRADGATHVRRRWPTPPAPDSTAARNVPAGEACARSRGGQRHVGQTPGARRAGDPGASRAGAGTQGRQEVRSGVGSRNVAADSRQWPIRAARAMPGRAIVGAAPRLLREWRAFLGTLRLNLVLARAVREHSAVIHAHDLDTLPAGVRLARRRGARLIYDAHELYPEMLSAASPLYTGLWRLTEHRLIGAADAVVTVNEAIATELQRRHRLPRRPTVIMNCPAREPEPGPTEDQWRHITLLYHGAFTTGRGLEALVQAMAGVDERATLTLRGDGPLLPVLQQIVQDTGTARRVRFTPPVPPDQLVSGMAGCSIGIVPYLPVSLNNYLCTPNKLFEYMMGGLAVVATDLPELRRIVTESGCGLLYAPDDAAGLAGALNALIRDPTLLATCRTAARRAAVERYNWDRQAAQLRRLYGEVLPP
jgi:glycosyltransferase involved in cell wall biosynthesis